MRNDGRAYDQFRDITIHTNYIKNAHGSCLLEMGNTRVICTAMIERSVPRFMTNTGKGWLTAEYSMLPASTNTRKQRDRGGKVDGRTTEIQRLIGRSLRAAVDLEMLGEKTIWVDCDVIEADGGTRTASITGACIAVGHAIQHMKDEGEVFARSPLKNLVAAISVGYVKRELCLDLCYIEDSRADVDMNVVMTDDGNIVEVQGTAEQRTFTRDQLLELLDVSHKGINRLHEIQKQHLPS